MGVYCTEDDFMISPGLYTHSKTVAELEAEGSCCQFHVCGLLCPAKVDKKGVAVTFGVPVAVVALLLVIMGWVIAKLMIKGSYKNFFVCSRTLPLYVVVFALLGQGLDSNSTLGNVNSAYKYGFWDGAVLPLGLGISLVLNSILLAGPINRMGLLTLPDLFRRKYGQLMEVIVSCIEITSFIFLMAGNLVGISIILQFCFDIPKGAGIVLSGGLMASFVAAGGLFSVALTDVPMASFGFLGLLVTTIYMLTNENGPNHPTPSLGFALTLDEANNITAITPGFTGPLDCSADPVTGASTCDNYAYPIGDHLVYPRSMEDPDAYAPFPNAILLNWATIFVLGLGNLCALDFQARTMASKNVLTARIGNLLAGILLICISMPFGLLAGLARKYYGPDSPYAVFDADTCSAPLQLPSCAAWVPEPKYALFNLLWTHAPKGLGAWTTVAIVCASMSTTPGACLACATVASHNLWRKVPKYGSKDENLLWVARLFVLPVIVCACAVASETYNTGYLLVVAFDIVLAGVLVPLLAAVYWKGITPNAGLLACVLSSTLRIILEFTLPKDGSLVAFGKFALQYGKAIPGLPSFMEILPASEQDNMGVWANPDDGQCKQEKMADWTGLDSVICPVFCLLVLTTVFFLEKAIGPNRDILFFIPKSWRETEPLYQLDEDSPDADASNAPVIKVGSHSDDSHTAGKGGVQMFPV